MEQVAHEPTRKEVFGEMVNGIRQHFSGDNLKNIKGQLKQTGKKFLVAAGVVSILPYILPTVNRRIRDVKFSSNEDTKLDVTDHVGFYTGSIIGSILYVPQLIGYSYASEHNHPEALLIPVITNVISGFYEGARKRVIENKQSNLERGVQ